MLEHGRRLAALAPNVAIKVPATPAGIAAGAELVASGINVNATVSFTLPQALDVAEAFEGAIDRAKAAGHDMRRLHPYVTLMVGRLDDHLQRVLPKEQVSIDPGYLHWAGIAVFKKARGIFRERGLPQHAARRRLSPPPALVAAHRPGRRALHALRLVEAVRGFGYRGRRDPRPPVEPRIVDALYARFADFRRAYDENGLRPEEFVRYGATIHTLNQFIGGYQDLLAIVRERTLR